jgi:ribosomal-protein-alanine N-acetyltransferase
MMDPFQHPVRAMEESDLAAVANLDALCQGHPWAPEHFREELARGESGHARVATGPSHLVEGYFCGWLVLDELHVGSLGVDPARRRRGIGRRLVQEAHSWASARGATLSHLEVRSGNIAAISLYASLGYRRVGIRRAYYLDNGEDAHLLVCDLGASVRETVA